MTRKKKLDPSILEAAKQFDAKQFAESVRGAFADFPEYRYRRSRILHPPWYLSLIILCGFFCGCNTISEIAEYAELQEEWFGELLGAPQTAPCYNALWWFLVKTNPEVLKTYFATWFANIPGQLRDQLLAIDGKRLKGAKGLDKITHVVEMFAAEDRLVLAVEKVPDKTVEKSCLGDLLKQVDVSGAIISGDAHFTTPEVARQIVESGADYLLAVKENQPNLCAELRNYFGQARAVAWEGVKCSTHTATDKGHGRIETREVSVVDDLEWLPQRHAWAGLGSLIEIRSTRRKPNGSGRIEEETRLYISSRRSTAVDFSGMVRGHWGIENHCHWLLDVIFEEDMARSDVGHSAENLGLFRRLVMNIVAVVDPTRGLASARRSATFSSNYLKGCLAKIFFGLQYAKSS